ncbi:PASTA domain-containing protein [Flavobacterium urocaniciphilum]|uniref:PASTA domain-containing protein n=1 Tax=Flavobacterium urocaniciphilum TaxID=1299341 RepID=A0A1H8ZGJ3_9FLAO|nr:PASTA domain-containing protein [Flavobacterium urocaniciphilum]SEP63425.1 PASTA domain-containing protein [Flavobacterium urocaniciphilum]
MSFKKFLFSFTFFKNLFIALIIVVLFLVAFVKFLDFSTNHGEEITVPNLSKMKLEVAEEKLDDEGLEVFLLDTVDFRPEFPPYSIVEQDPIAGSKVKDGRKIYVKLNAGGFAMVTFPDLKDKTFRQATNTLRALGLVEGELKYVPNIAKDIVLEVSCNGKPVKAGDKLMKNSKIDFVLGDGKDLFKEEELDSLNMDQQEIEKDTTH